MTGLRREADGRPRPRAEEEVIATVRGTLRRVFAIARRRGTDPEAAPRGIALERLERAAARRAKA